MTEGICPSDGLTVEKAADGTPFAIWRCYNGWAAAVLEGIAESMIADA